jgi:hypothetical protein
MGFRTILRMGSNGLTNAISSGNLSDEANRRQQTLNVKRSLLPSLFDVTFIKSISRRSDVKCEHHDILA